MTKYMIFFRNNLDNVQAEFFIKNQRQCFKAHLEEAVHMLSTTGQIKGLRSGRLTDGDWSIFLEDENGERHNFLLYISQFELSVEQEKVSSTNLPKTKQLVIIDPGGPRDSVGGFHPGYWDIESFGSGMDEVSRDYFINVIAEIKYGASSKDFSNNIDGSVSIHINRPDIAHGIHINCTGKYI